MSRVRRAYNASVHQASVAAGGGRDRGDRGGGDGRLGVSVVPLPLDRVSTLAVPGYPAAEVRYDGACFA